MDGIESSNRVIFFRRHHRPWTTRELAELRRLAHLGAEECARRLGRSVWSVKRVAELRRISLRRPGERRGLVLGQRRSEHLAPEQRAARLPARPERKLCPSCASRRVAHVNGLCDICHERRAVARALEELEALEVGTWTE